MNTRTVTIETLQARQSRRYGPTEHKYRLTFTHEGQYGWKPSGERVKRIVEAINGDRQVCDKDDPGREWWKPFYKEFTEETPGVWIVHIYQEYLD